MAIPTETFRGGSEPYLIPDEIPKVFHHTKGHLTCAQQNKTLVQTLFFAVRKRSQRRTRYFGVARRALRGRKRSIRVNQFRGVTH